MANNQILATAKQVCVSQDVVNVRTIQGNKFRGYVDKVRTDSICILYFGRRHSFRGYRRATLRTKDIASINISKAFN